MTAMNQIKERMAHYVEKNGEEPWQTSQHIETFLVFGIRTENIMTPLITCKDCKHATMSMRGYCKYCYRLYTNDDGEPDAQVNFDADFFCGFAERKDV